MPPLGEAGSKGANRTSPDREWGDGRFVPLRTLEIFLVMNPCTIVPWLLPYSPSRETCFAATT